jgi:hypothetical protein
MAAERERGDVASSAGDADHNPSAIICFRKHGHLFDAWQETEGIRESLTACYKASLGRLRVTGP